MPPGKVSTIDPDLSSRDQPFGFSGLALLKINFKNALNTVTSFFTNANTVARTYTFQDRDGTIADNTDLATIATAINLKVSKDSDTGAAFLPSGTTLQRPPTGINGYTRYNTDLSTVEAFVNNAWRSISGALGGASDNVFQENDHTVTASYTVGVGKNALSVGSVTINSGINVTIPAGSRWLIL